MDYFKIIELNGKRLAVYKTGEIIVWNDSEHYHKPNQWIKHSTNYDSYGYSRLYLKPNYFKVSRIIAMTYLGLEINNTKVFVDHIDRDVKNNNIQNLRLVTLQQNAFNKKNVKGYRMKGNSIYAYICINGKDICLGKFDTKEEAKQAYLDAKEIYHTF